MPTLPSFRVENTTAHSRTEWVNASIPFAPGVAADETALGTAIAAGKDAELIPIKWHYDSKTGARSSIALAILRTEVTLAPNEVRTITPVIDRHLLPAFTRGPRIGALLGSSAREEAATLDVTLTGDPMIHHVALFAGVPKTIAKSATRETLRFRGHAGPMATNVYVTLDRAQDHGEIVIQLANDELETFTPALGVDRVDLRTTSYLDVAIHDRGAYAIAPTSQSGTTTLLQGALLGDGVEWTVRGHFASGTDPRTKESALAATEEPLFPIAEFGAWKKSQAAGPLGLVFDPRFTNAEDGRKAVADLCHAPVVGGAFDELGVINKRPSGTGDQADFGSNLPVFYVQAIQTGSPCPLRRPWLGVHRETLRPSQYFARRSGVEDRVKATDYPDLFFWNGRPHFDGSWNPQYPEWKPRPLGDFETYGWGAMDDQHYSNNALRAVYELTGDPFLGEVLIHHQTLVIWDYLTKWFDNVSSERGARLMKEAILLYAVDDSTPVAELLRAKVIAKNKQTYRRLVDTFVTKYGIAAIDAFKDDGRVPLTIQYPGKEVGIGWQTGFQMEFQHLAFKNGWDPETAAYIIDRYLDSARTARFLPDGTPVTYFLMENPSERETGGIGSTWWSGFVQAAKDRPLHPNHDFVVGTVGPKLVPAPPPSTYWIGDDRWRSF